MEEYERIPLSGVHPLKSSLSEKELVAEIEKIAVTLGDIRKRGVTCD